MDQTYVLRDMDDEEIKRLHLQHQVWQAAWLIDWTSWDAGILKRSYSKKSGKFNSYTGNLWNKLITSTKTSWMPV